MIKKRRKLKKKKKQTTYKQEHTKLKKKKETINKINTEPNQVISVLKRILEFFQQIFYMNI